MKAFSDEEIIEKIKSANNRHNDQALEYVYQRYYGQMVLFVKRNGGNQKDAEDVFQESVLAFYNQIKKGTRLNCTVQTYLYSINRNLWLKFLRGKSKEIVLRDEHEHIPVDEDVFAALVAGEKTKILADMMEQLGGRCQELLVHFYFEKLRLKQIVEVMGWNNEKTAKNIKARCLKKLKELIGEHDSFRDYFN